MEDSLKATNFTSQLHATRHVPLPFLSSTCFFTALFCQGFFHVYRHRILAEDDHIFYLQLFQINDGFKR